MYNTYSIKETINANPRAPVVAIHQNQFMKTTTNFSELSR